MATRLSVLSRAIGLSFALVLMAGTFAPGGQPATPLGNGVNITGNVVNESGSPVPNLLVRLLSDNPQAEGPKPVGPGGSGTGDSAIAPRPENLQRKGGAAVRAARTDASGNFTFAEIGPGKYIVTAGTGRSAVQQPVEVKAGQTPAPVKLQLHK